MAGSSMGPDVGRIATRLSTAVSRGRGKVLRSATTKAKAIQQASIAGVVGGDMRMSGVGRSGAKVGVRYDVSGNLTSALLRATGPLHLVERATSPHLITSRYGAGSRRSRANRAAGGGAGTFGPVLGSRIGGGRRAVLGFGDGEFARYARHPGTSGQAPWAKGRKRAEPVIRNTIRKETRSIISAAAGR